jgi:hypothetical protein
VELWEEGTLVAGEVGYAIGRVYTSLTGFRTESKTKLAYGIAQLVALGKLLKLSGFELWNLGHPPKGRVMKYKIELGGTVLPRNEFLDLWRQAREADSRPVECLIEASGVLVKDLLILNKA